MKLLAWKGDLVVDGTNSRMRRVIETDYETIHRQNRLAKQQQHIDIFILAAWISAAMLSAAWIRVMWIVGKAGVNEFMAWVGR